MTSKYQLRTGSIRRGTLLDILIGLALVGIGVFLVFWNNFHGNITLWMPITGMLCVGVGALLIGIIVPLKLFFPSMFIRK